MDVLAKFIYKKQNPNAILLAGKNSRQIADLLNFLLRKFFVIKQLEIGDGFVRYNEAKNANYVILRADKITDFDIKFLLENSKTCIAGFDLFEAPLKDKEIFLNRLANMKNGLQQKISIIHSQDKPEFSECLTEYKIKAMSFGMEPGCDILASDMNFGSKGNFKINYKGKTIPIWIGNLGQKNQVSSALCAIGLVEMMGLNLIEISQEFRYYSF